MTVFDAIILGAVQGATEFLPVSSTGHLVLARELFGMTDAYGLAFDAVLHLATALTVIVYFRKDIWQLLQTALRALGRMPVNAKDMLLLKAILIGMLPAGIVGVLLEDYIAGAFRNPLMIAGVLLFGSLIFAIAEYSVLRTPRTALTVRKGIGVGLWQVLALLPGMSRSGITIAGGMLLGLSRFEAARFTFLLALPLILGAGGKKLLDLMGSGEAVDWTLVGLGALTSFFVGLMAVHFMLSFVRRYTLWPFIWYRVILAIVVLGIFWM
jgi:undecaprenyl-diphosphatase